MNFIPGEDYGRIINEGQEHLPCAIVLDVSDSMRPYLSELKDGLDVMKSVMQENIKCVNTVDTTIITYSEHAKVVDPFKSCSEMVLPELATETTTSLYEALELAINEIQNRKEQYRLANTAYKRGWIFLFSDGYPTDARENKDRVMALLKEKTEGKSVTVFPIAIGDQADEKALAEFTAFNANRKGFCLRVSPENIEGCFEWLSSSVVKGASTTEDTIDLTMPPEISVITIPLDSN